MIRHAPTLNSYLLRDAECLLMTREQLLRGGPVTSLVVELCSTPQTVDSLVEACREAFGDPPTGDITTVLTTALDDLVDADVLTRDDA